MQSRSPSWLSAALVVCLLPAGARAQVIPFGPYFGPGLSSSDNQMVFESAARVNAAAPGKVGQSDSWRNPQTKSHSSSTITRVFTSGAMPCHLVRHHIVAGPRPASNYRFTWCRTPSGEWKIKS
jgi:surface antigen